MSKAGRQYTNSSTHTVTTKKSKARVTAAINDHILTLRSALFTPTGKDKDVTEGISPMFMKYDRNGLDLLISFTAKLSKEELKWSFDNCKENMEAKYDASGYGWDDDDKRKEFNEEGTRFFIVREKSTEDGKLGRMMGFAHFRFSVQGDIVDQMVGSPSLFVWDIHLDESVRRKGLGKHMMTVLELIARREGMQTISIPVQMFDASTTAWIESGLKGYSADLILKDVTEFDPDMEGFNVFSKAIGASASKPSVPLPSVPLVAVSESTTAKVAVAQSAPSNVFKFVDTSANETAGAASSGESDNDDSDGEAPEPTESAEDEELDFSKLDLHDTIHGLKVLYIEKHGEEPSDEVVEQWHENLKSAVPDQGAPAPEN